MESSLYLARFIGIVSVLIPLLLWFDKTKTKELVALTKGRVSIGLLALLTSSAMIATHQEWRFNLIVLIEWLILLFGIILISSKVTATKLFSFIERNMAIILVVSFMLGIYLIRIGFFAR